MNQAFPRRRFLRQTTFSAAGLSVLDCARLAFAYEANDKLNIAAVGIGGQGQSNLENLNQPGQNIVALCDVDRSRAAESVQKHRQAKLFQDFRRMLDEMGSGIDAVLVSTPDHTHAVAAATAIKLGKHVYCEKPLARTVREARILRELARKHRVVTQLGNQGSAEPGLRRALEIVESGMLGEIREAHVWLAGGNQPQKIPRDTPPIPEGLSWDLWLGPAPQRPYHTDYLPAKWRGWRAFGSGIVGDFGCHTANLAFRALRLAELWRSGGASAESGAPGSAVIKVEAMPSERDEEGYPKSMTAKVSFSARGSLPAGTLTLYAKTVPSEELMLGHPRGAWGDLLVGTRGSIYSDCPWNTRFALLPKGKFSEAQKKVPETLPRSKGHHAEWVAACKGRGEAFSSFEIGGPMTELMQLINAATLIPGVVEYDPVAGTIISPQDANPRLHREYRSGWLL